MSSLLAAVLARAQSFLLEPAAAPPAEIAETPPPVHYPLQVAVIGLSRRSGATLVARGLAQALIARGRADTHVLSFAGEDSERPARLGPVTGWEIPLALREPSEVAEYGATVGRLGGPAATLVWDFSAADSERAAEALRASDRVVAVASAGAEPALAALVCSMLAERAGSVLLAANRVREPELWAGRCAVILPESRLGVLSLAHGRLPGGELGTALRRLTAAVEERED
jgi:hypothetical protein